MKIGGRGETAVWVRRGEEGGGGMGEKGRGEIQLRRDKREGNKGAQWESLPY